MPLSLSPATLIDGPSIAPIAADAFMAESFTHALFPGQTRTDQIEGFIARWPKTVSEPNTRHFVVRDTETGEVVGWSDWLIQMRDGRELGRVKGEGGSSKGGSDGIGNGKMEVEEEKVGSAKEKGVDGTEEKWPVAGSILKEAPNPPKGMNNALQISFGKKIQAMREKHLWGRPALCTYSSLYPPTKLSSLPLIPLPLPFSPLHARYIPRPPTTRRRILAYAMGP
ncbi:hypothetical protein MMC14_006572 [Varicellaria rhodocarpa]|nr:hypothetical protein [Varicellaria rhodocarpa]